MRNGDKNQFSSSNQPDRDAKKQGWMRKKQRQQFMDTVLKYQELPSHEFLKARKSMSKSKGDYTIGELIAFEYVHEDLL